MNSQRREYIRTIIFGVEDSLVSTTGLIAGLSVGTNNKSVVIIGGVVAIAVEAISMGAGEYISDDAIEEANRSKRGPRGAFKSGLLMLVSYFLAGLIPLLPIVVFVYPTSLYISLFLALCGLFALGYAKGKVLNTNPWRGAIKVLIVGGLATILGIVVGLVFKI
jgi:VIT1/CCC1 family predicted Fe2+/Mn2+ transporter